jgi:hypothetical protein
MKYVVRGSCGCGFAYGMVYISNKYKERYMRDGYMCCREKAISHGFVFQREG